MNSPKPVWASKTFIVNAIAMVVMFASMAGFDLGLTEADTAQLAAGIMTIVNIVLRFVTKSPVTITGK